MLLPVVVLLGEVYLRLNFGDVRGCLLERGLELLDVLLGLSQRRLLLLENVLVRLGIDLEEHVPFLEWNVGRDWNLGHHASDGRKDRRRVEIQPCLPGEGMVVIHDKKDEADEQDAAEHCRRDRPLVYWYTEDPEDRVADRGIR